MSELGSDGDGTGWDLNPSVLGLKMYWGCPRYPLEPTCLEWLLRAKHREAPSLFVIVAPGWQFTKGSDTSERSPWGGTEEEAPLSPRWQQVGKTRQAVPGSLTW